MFKFGKKKKTSYEDDYFDDDYNIDEDDFEEEDLTGVGIKSMTLSEIKKIEKERKKLEKQNLRDKWRDSTTMFSDLELIINFVLFFIVHFGMFFYLSENLTISIIIGFVGMFYTFFVFSYPNRKLSLYQDDLNSLLQYVFNMTFFLGNNSNVLRSLESARDQASERIQPDIDRTIRAMNDRAELETDHFKKYKYPGLNQFHDNLRIYKERGGNPEEMFESIRNSMTREITKRDELRRKRRGFSMQVYILVGLVAFMGALLKNITPGMWQIFIHFNVLGIGTLIATYVAILLNLKLLQKHNLDIAVKL